MAQGSKSFTTQIDSATSQKVNDEHYVMQLNPSIDIPYLAKPRAQLESLAFTNSFGNLDAQEKNNVLKLGWHSHVIGSPTPMWKTADIALDSCQYDIPSLEVNIAKKIKALSDKTPTLGSDLWTTMDTYCGANATSLERVVATVHRCHVESVDTCGELIRILSHDGVGDEQTLLHHAATAPWRLPSVRFLITDVQPS